MATKTTQVHVRHCDRCTDKVPRGKPRYVLGPSGLAELTEEQSSPTSMDLCTPCETSLAKWWTRPERTGS